MADSDKKSEVVSGVTAKDPTKGASPGTAILFKKIGKWESDATEVPSGLNNWHAFEGALLAVLLKSKKEAAIFGTAVMIAPGLAVSATHVFNDNYRQLETGEMVVNCVGIRQNELMIWNVRSISANENDDICLLAIEAISDFPEDMTYYKFGVSTRVPLADEEVSIIGFRSAGSELGAEEALFLGNYHISRGKVMGTYPKGMPKRFMPYPLIEISCGSLGGMSGGAVVDDGGLVLGIISRGLETEDQRGPTYANWIISAMSREINLEWPLGLHTETKIVCELRPELLFIDNRDSLKGTTKDKLAYRTWMNS